MEILGTHMMKKDDDAVLAALREVLDGKGSRRSRLDLWMTKHYAEFADLLRGKRPNWAELTRVFEEMGLGEDGKPMGSQTARQTWWLVRRRQGDLRKAKKAAKAESTGLALGVIREVVDPPSSPSPERRHRVAPITPVSPTGPVAVVQQVESVEKHQGDPDEVMRALDAQLNSRRQSMPKPIK